MSRPLKLISDQMNMAEIHVLLRELRCTLDLGIEGDVVELGCYEGTSALFLQKLLSEQASEKRLHVYDSFAGLPEKSNKDRSAAGDQFKAGELIADKSKLVRNFRHAGLVKPDIHQGWFADITQQDMPKKISFAFLDGDFYESIRSSFELIQNNLSDKATIVVDDYQIPALPGATRAVDEWLLKNRCSSFHHEQSLAIIRL